MADLRGPNNAAQRSTPGGAFADRAWMAWVTRCLHNIYVGSSKGMAGPEGVRIPDPSASESSGSWRMWYSGGLLWVGMGRMNVTDAIGGVAPPYDLNDFPAWSAWADRTAAAVAVDPSVWSFGAAGTAVYFYYHWPTGRAFIDTMFGRGIALDRGPIDWQRWYYRADGWRSLYLGTIHSGTGGIYVTPSYPASFAYAKGLQCRFRVQTPRVLGWANNSGTGMGFVPDISGVTWAPSVELPLNSQGYLYYREIPDYPGTGGIVLTVEDFCVGYYVTDSIGILYLWETPLANLQPLP